jgi:hypothetical protein
MTHCRNLFFHLITTLIQSRMIKLYPLEEQFVIIRAEPIAVARRLGSTIDYITGMAVQ